MKDKDPIGTSLIVLALVAVALIVAVVALVV